MNRLAGRAWKAELFPLTSHELGSAFDLEKYLTVGGLPSVYLGKDPQEELAAYIETYLKEEILEEAIVRNLPAFSRFLKTVALSDAQIINFSAVGRDAQVAPSTVREYFSVLEDTLLGFTLQPWKLSKKRKAIEVAKFYLFDIGVSNALRRVEVVPRNSDLYGSCFEQFITMECRAYLSYSRSREVLTFWRTVNGQEVDLLIGDRVALEIKATSLTCFTLFAVKPSRMYLPGLFGPCFVLLLYLLNLLKPEALEFGSWRYLS